MEVTWKVLRAQLYCHVQRIRVIHEAETVPSHGSSLWPLAEIPLSEDSNYSSQGSQCQCRFVFDTRSITSQVIKRMVLYPSLFHIVTSQEICIKSATVLSEQRLSLNRPSYRNSPKIAPVLASFPGNCIGQESRCYIY